MKLEKTQIVINGKTKEFYLCIGDGQCSCKDCEKEKGWNRHWTNSCYKINEKDNFVLCQIHLMKRLSKE